MILVDCKNFYDKLGKQKRRVREERAREKEQEKSPSAEILPCPKSG
jgi:hypothetical protein